MKLIDFYIENKNQISLHFDDGSSKTVSIKQLRRHIDGEDLAKVLHALEIKKTFFNRFPNWLKVLSLSTSLLALLAASGRAARPIWQPSDIDNRRPAGAAEVMAVSSESIKTPGNNAAAANQAPKTKPYNQPAAQPVDINEVKLKQTESSEINKLSHSRGRKLAQKLKSDLKLKYRQRGNIF